MSVVSFSCLFFDNEAGNKSADSEIKEFKKKKFINLIQFKLFLKLKCN